MLTLIAAIMLAVVSAIFLMYSLTEEDLNDKAWIPFTTLVFCLLISLDIIDLISTNKVKVQTATDQMVDQAIKNGAAHWTINPTTKETLFVWDGKNPPQVEKKP